MKTKEIITGFFGKALEILNLIGSVLVVIVLYLIVGFALALWYTFFAGPSGNAFVFLMFLLPVALLILFIIYKMYRDKVFESLKAFWIFLGYCLMPIIFNGISIILTRAGFGAVGEYIFKYRYDSLVAVPMGIVVICVMWGIWEVFSGKGKDLLDPSELADA